MSDSIRGNNCSRSTVRAVTSTSALSWNCGTAALRVVNCAIARRIVLVPLGPRPAGSPRMAAGLRRCVNLSASLSTSASTMRPPGPLPATDCGSIPSERIKRRERGEAATRCR